MPVPGYKRLQGARACMCVRACVCVRVCVCVRACKQAPAQLLRQWRTH